MKILQVVMHICEACVDGVGKECHTPGCALCYHAVDLPIHRELLTVLSEYEYDEGKEAEVKRLRGWAAKRACEAPKVAPVASGCSATCLIDCGECEPCLAREVKP